MVTLENGCRYCIHREESCLYRGRYQKYVKEISEKLRDIPTFMGIDISCLRFEEDGSEENQGLL